MNTLKCWVARNGTGQLILFTGKPYRRNESLMSDEELRKAFPRDYSPRVSYPRQWYRPRDANEISFKKLPLPVEMFDFLKWEGEPVEIELSVRIVNQ